MSCILFYSPEMFFVKSYSEESPIFYQTAKLSPIQNFNYLKVSGIKDMLSLQQDTLKM